MNPIKARVIIYSIKIIGIFTILGIAGAVLLYLIKHIQIIWR